MSAAIHFPTGPVRADQDHDPILAAALDVSSLVFSGERVSLQAMVNARAVINERSRAKAIVALLGRYIDARRDEIRTDAAAQAKRGTIRAALMECAGLAVIVGLSLAVYGWESM